MNIILGAGISGLSAAYTLRNNKIESVVFEKSKSWGGLLDNFQINGFRFDKFIHLSFSQDEYVNSVFCKTPLIRHKPLSYNYYKSYWLKHPAQNNLFPLSEVEKELIIKDFKLSKEVNIDQCKNYEDWLRMQFGDYFAENFPMKYTKKYWTVDAKDLETKWVGSRMYKSTLEEIEMGMTTDQTPNTYYAKEMRYPELGGYKSFLNPLINGLSIKTDSRIVGLDLLNKEVELESGETYKFQNIISSLPLPEICKLVRDIPSFVVDASNKLNFTSGYLVSLGFKRPNVTKKLWFYIYDDDLLPSRVYSPSIKSPDNAPIGCSSIQAEVYFNKGIKFSMTDEEVLEKTIDDLVKMGLFKREDIIVKDIRTEKYANVIFDHDIYVNRKIVLDYLESNNVISIGRFGEWDYFWSDQSMLSGKNGALKLLDRLKG